MSLPHLWILLGRAAAFAPRAGRAFARGDAGATMAEYAMLIAVIALVAVAGARKLGTTMRDGASYAATLLK